MRNLCWSLLACCGGVLAAEAGEIRGRVLTPQGMPVAEARISVENEDKQQFRRAVLTRPDGTYTVPDLDQGVYVVRITGPAGQPSLLRYIVVGTPDTSVRIDFRLPIPVPGQTHGPQDQSIPHAVFGRPDLRAVRQRLMIERGADSQYIAEFLPERNYFGAEYGAPLREFSTLARRSHAPRWNYSVTQSVEYSALNARSFFNVGALPDSRKNHYQFAAGGPVVRDRVSLLIQYGRLRESGEMNGNAQVPRPDERGSLAEDPRGRAMVNGLLGAFPATLPNSTHVTERQLNDNESRSLAHRDGLLRLDFRLAENSGLGLLYSVSDDSEDPFELVAGQNPQTDLRNQRIRLGLTHSFSPSAVGQFGFDFDRAAADLSLTQRYRSLFLGPGLEALEAFVPDVDFQGDSLQDIGPGAEFPRRRAQNRFALYASVTKITSRHSLKAGWGVARVQVNDLQSDHSRGSLLFAADFGRTEIENFLLGQPTQLTFTLGNLYRGFRGWEHFFHFGDQIRLTPNLHLSLGLRYELQTAPTEVNGLTEVGYATDGTNWAPRAGLAWNPAGGLVTVRAGYGISYGSVFPETYQFARFSAPGVRTVRIPAPDITRLFSIPSPAIPGPARLPGEREVLHRISPDLVTPYSHQYSLAMESSLPGSLFLRLAYLGSRSFHLFTQNVSNRARPVPGVEPTTASIDARRPDPRNSDILEIASNGNAYYDAAQISLEKRLSRGVSFRAVYTFSKSLDLGGDFTSTASGVETPAETGILTSEFASRKSDQKGPSLFDTPHNLTLSYTFALPSVGHITGWTGLLLRDWEVSGTTLFQAGLPWHARTADGPGWGNVDGVSNDRPNLLNPALLGRSFDRPEGSAALLRREDFDTRIPPGGSGNLGPNVFRKDGTNIWNVSIGKAIRVRRWGEAAVEFRAAFLNLLNQAQFSRPGGNLSSPVFGRITDTVHPGRVTQLSVRARF